MASVHGEYNKCEIVWDTYTQKYLRNEDICATCNGNQIAIWTGGGGSKKAQLRCERRLTHKLGHIVIRFGSKGYDANSESPCDHRFCNRVFGKLIESSWTILGWLLPPRKCVP